MFEAGSQSFSAPPDNKIQHSQYTRSCFLGREPLIYTAILEKHYKVLTLLSTVPFSLKIHSSSLLPGKSSLESANDQLRSSVVPEDSDQVPIASIKIEYNSRCYTYPVHVNPNKYELLIIIIN